MSTYLSSWEFSVVIKHRKLNYHSLVPTRTNACLRYFTFWCSLCLVCVIFHMKLHSYLAGRRTGYNMYVVEIFHVNDLLRTIPAHSSPCHVLQICTRSHCNSFLSLTTDLLNFSVRNLFMMVRLDEKVRIKKYYKQFIIFSKWTILWKDIADC